LSFLNFTGYKYIHIWRQITGECDHPGVPSGHFFEIFDDFLSTEILMLQDAFLKSVSGEDQGDAVDENDMMFVDN